METGAAIVVRTFSGEAFKGKPASCELLILSATEQNILE
jgi:hypothetical protein